MNKIFCDVCGKHIEYGYGKNNTATKYTLSVRENNQGDLVSEVGDCCVPCFNDLVGSVRRIVREWRRK